MKTIQTCADVIVIRDQIVKVDRAAVARLCAHPGPHQLVHEMLIVLDEATYVRPHRHPGKSESFHVIAGSLTVVVFSDDGDIKEVISMGDYHSGRTFYYRLQEPAYHTVLPSGGQAIIHETTNGPFEPGQTEFAPWAPPEDNSDAGQTYLNALAHAIGLDQSWKGGQP